MTSPVLRLLLLAAISMWNAGPLGAEATPLDDWNSTIQLRAGIGRIMGTPACAKGKTFCEEIDGYPRDLIDNLMAQHGERLAKLFDNGVVAKLSPIEEGINPPDYTDLCPTVMKHYTIKAAKNMKNEWNFIVNHGPYLQTQISEMCTWRGGNSHCRNVGLGFTTECVQKHTLRMLVAVTHEGLGRHPFLIPSCCSCILKA